MQINIRPLEAFEITDDAGKTIATVRVKSRWNGLMELVTDDGQLLIVEEFGAMAGQLARAFNEIFRRGSPSTLTCRLVKASPDLLAKLRPPAPPLDTVHDVLQALGTVPATHKERAAL